MNIKSYNSATCQGLTLFTFNAQIEAGKYTKGMYERARYWYLAEVIIGPIVIGAVFFLLKQFTGTMMTGIAEEEVRGSIYLSSGISFTWAFHTKDLKYL